MLAPGVRRHAFIGAAGFAAVHSETRRAGFTIIETLLVLAIVLMVAVVAFPDIARLGGSNTDALARQLDAGLARARAQAMRTGRVVLVLAESPSPGVVELVGSHPRDEARPRQGDRNAAAGPASAPDSRRVFATLSGAVEVRLEGQEALDQAFGSERVPASVHFAVALPDGSVHAVPGERGSIVLTDRWGAARTVRLAEWTGRVVLGDASVGATRAPSDADDSWPEPDDPEAMP